MSWKKVIGICQSGGEFVRNRDGSLSYSGGDAYAIEVDGDTKLDELRAELGEMFKCSVDGMCLKYLLPGNRNTLITISTHKDLHRMLSFVADSHSVTVDLFVIPPAAPATSIVSAVAEEDAIAVACKDDDASVAVLLDNANNTSSSSVNVKAANATVKAASQWENTITGVDQRFSSFSDFREALHKYSIAHGFAYRYKKNDSHRVTVKCKSHACPWRIYASRLSTTQLVCIKRMHPHHTCEGASVKAGYRATRGWVGTIIKEKLKLAPNYKPKDIALDFQRDYGIHLNYSQAWRAKEIAREQLQGSYKDAYTHLPSFCDNIIRTNPGSVATFSTNDDSTFHRLFVAFHASLLGFRQGCRPLLFLDSTLLNSKYQGALLSATAPDGDDGIFPVAFAVVDADTDDNWHWFLTELKSALAMPPQQHITFVTDLRASLKHSLLEIFGGECHHSLCLRHLAEKLNRDLKGQFSHEARRFMINDLYAAAYAPKLEDFERNLESIKSISPDAYEWVTRSEAKHWANAFFEGARYNLATSGFGQQFYSWVSEAHELPITQMLDVLRGKMMQSMYTRRVESAQWTTNLTPSKEEKLQKESVAAQSLQVLILQDSTFEVGGERVELDRWFCSCKEWQLSGVPCSHAVAVMECTGRSPYHYCSSYFTADNYRLTYAQSIQPIPDVDKPILGDTNLALVTVTPPPTKRPPGRPKAPKTDSIDIIKRQLQCSNCKGLGHNKKTCKQTNQTSTSLSVCL